MYEKIEIQQKSKRTLNDTLYAFVYKYIFNKYFDRVKEDIHPNLLGNPFLFKSSAFYAKRGFVSGTFKGVSNTYFYTLEIKVDRDNPNKMELYRFRLRDWETGQFFFVIESGKEQDVEQYNKKQVHISSSNSIPFNLSTNEVRDILQREWDCIFYNESHKVNNVHIEKVIPNEVLLSYDLHSTYNGKNEFKRYKGTLEACPDGSWHFIDLYY